jgi:NAD(P)-dependent dehydrogenase (short-subunit alcohol dehydrogenase family)
MAATLQVTAGAEPPALLSAERVTGLTGHLDSKTIFRWVAWSADHRGREKAMDIKGSVALVTGAGRGIGRAFTRALIEHGAAKVYAGVRDPSSVTDPDLTALRLDVTSPEDIAGAAKAAGDVDIVINNAGILGNVGDLLEGDLDVARQVMEANFFGTWAVSRAFAPILARSGGGALVNMLSVASWNGSDVTPVYAASKAAQWSLTDAFRKGLRKQGTLVVGVHVGPVDTDGSAWMNTPKVDAAEVAERALRALEAGQTEVLVDELARTVKASLSQPR